MAKLLLSCLALLLALPVHANAQDDAKQKCSPHNEPRKLPPVDAVVDSAALGAALDSLAGDGFLDARIAVHQGKAGSAALFRIGSDPAPGDPVLAAIGAVLRPDLEAIGASVVLRARIEQGILLVVEHSVFCAPVIVPGSTVQRSVVQVTAAEAAQVQAGNRIRTPVLRVRIGLDGIVREVQLQSGSGLRSLDADLIRITEQTRYLPALLNGRPVEVWLIRNRAEIIR